MSTFPPTISDALYALGIDGGWKIKEGKIAKWYSEETQPTEAEIDAEVNRLKADYNAKQYQRDRNYPDIGEQLDMLYWDKKNDTKNWEDAIDKVKADNPKPE